MGFMGSIRSIGFIRFTWSRRLLLGVAVLACVSMGLGGAESRAPLQSDGWQIPVDAASEVSPRPTTPERIARGKKIYEDRCRRCHGSSGEGTGPDADPDDPAGDLTDGSRAPRNPDGVMFYKIWNGRNDPKMPAFKTDLPREDVWTVIQYVKTLRR
jgi:mono/diheme cytochrome c family protein